MIDSGEGVGRGSVIETEEETGRGAPPLGLVPVR